MPTIGDVLRHGEAEVAGRGAGAERVHVVEGDDGARGRILGRQLVSRGAAMLGGVGVVEAEGGGARGDQARVERNSRLGEGVLVAAIALLAREGRGRAGDVADPPMAEVDQVAGGEVAGLAVVDADAVDGEVDAVQRRRQIERDQRQATIHEIGEVIEGEGRGAHDHAADAEIEKFRSVAALALGVAQAVAEDDLEAAFLGGNLDGAGHGAMRGIGDRGHEKAEHGHEAGLEVACGPARAIAELADRRLDALHSLRPHAVGTAVEKVRDRADRRAGERRDVADARPVSHSPSLASVPAGVLAARKAFMPAKRLILPIRNPLVNRSSGSFYQRGFGIATAPRPGKGAISMSVFGDGLAGESWRTEARTGGGGEPSR